MIVAISRSAVVLFAMCVGYLLMVGLTAGKPPQSSQAQSTVRVVVVTEDSDQHRGSVDERYPIDRPVFSEAFDLREALVVASNKQISEGQRNEALNALRTLDRTQAISVLGVIINDAGETLKFRSWVAQHLGLLGEKCLDSEFAPIIASLRIGLCDAVDGPLWRESLYALSGINSGEAVGIVRETLGSLTVQQRNDIGSLLNDISSRLVQLQVEHQVL